MKYAVMLLRYIKGYVLFRAEGGFTERFLNLCSQKGLVMWNMKREQNALIACINSKSFLKIRGAAGKSGVKITLIRKTGLLYLLRRYRKRSALAVGLIFFMIFHLVMNQFVWCIDISGNKKISDYEILEKASEANLSFGTFKKSFDEIKAARNIAASYDGRIIWMSINIKGSMAIIELRENTEVIKEIESNTPCNIVADFDGIIISAETYKGDCMIEAGSGVKKGELLISGAIDNEDASTTFYHAKGKITALHSREITVESSGAEQIKLSVYKEKIYLGILSAEIPLTGLRLKEDELLFSVKKHLNVCGYNLPFYVKKVILASKENIALSEEDYRSLFYYTASKEAYNSNINSAVISKDEKISLKDNSFIFSGKYNVIDFIGEEKPILSEK